MSHKQLIYTSTAVGNIACTALQVLERAAVFNLSRRITGMLAVDDHSFAQVLEGRSSDVDSLMARIARDPRHRDLRIVTDVGCVARMWPNWQMGVVAPTPANAPIFKRYGIGGSGGTTLAKLEPALLKALLMEFSEHAQRRRGESHLTTH